MGMTVRCNENSNNDGYRTVEEIVCETVTYFRNRGHRSEVAIEQAALALGLTPRKARSVFYGEAFTFLSCEIRRIRDAFVNHMEQQADEHARKAEAIREKLRNGVIL